MSVGVSMERFIKNQLVYPVGGVGESKNRTFMRFSVSDPGGTRTLNQLRTLNQ